MILEQRHIQGLTTQAKGKICTKHLQKGHKELGGYFKKESRDLSLTNQKSIDGTVEEVTPRVFKYIIRSLLGKLRQSVKLG